MTKDEMENLRKLGQQTLEENKSPLDGVLPHQGKDDPTFNQQFSDSIHESINEFNALEAKSNAP